MIQLDVKAEYLEMRASHGLPLHDPLNDRDLELLDFFRYGVLIGTRHALLCVNTMAEESIK